MPSPGMLRRVALVRTDVSEEVGGSFIRVTRIGELGTTLKNGVFWDVTSCGSCKNRQLLLFLVHHSCHPDEGGARFIRNVGSYKSHTA
jgi:hypothetical protein